MDPMISFGQLASLLKDYGPFGILIVIWYVDMRSIRKMNEQYRVDTQATMNQTKQIMSQHYDFMKEIRIMYESNVKLVEGYETLAGDLKEIIIMNTTNMVRLADEIRQNQFCPLQRFEKKKIEVKSCQNG